MAARPSSPAPWLALGAAIGLVFAAVLGPLRPLGAADEPGGRGGSAAEPDQGEGYEEDDPNEEAEEQHEGTEKRMEALEEAVRNGSFGKATHVKGRAAPGWNGQQVIAPTIDDWEPAVAADPSAPYVYLLTTRYAAKPCPGNCPSPWIALHVSSDGGHTFNAGTPLCACKGSGQFDPIVEVVRNTGAVYALYMNGFNVVFTKSLNHGAANSWSAPVNTYGNVSWNDKPVLAVSDDGRDVYVSFNGPTAGDLWMAQSHDFGTTWTQTKVVDSARYYYAYDADVLTDGTVVFAEGSVDYGSSGQKGNATGTVQQVVVRSTNRGSSWSVVPIDENPVGLACVAGGCSSDFYIGHLGIAGDGGNQLTLVYDAATTSGGLQSIYVRRSADKGVTWSPRTAISAGGEEAVAPGVESVGAGDVRVVYQQTAGANVDRWNTWSRRSIDGGATFAAAVKISDATTGPGYVTPAGYLEIYGDYLEVGITNTGDTFAAWGEGFSYDGPGGVWYALGR